MVRGTYFYFADSSCISAAQNEGHQPETERTNHQGVESGVEQVAPVAELADLVGTVNLAGFTAKRAINR